MATCDAKLPKGVHPFAVFQWELIGLRRDLKLVTVALSEDIGEHLLKLFQCAEDSPLSAERFVSSTQIEDLESRHYSLWNAALTKHRRRIINLAKFKQQSLNASQEGRMAILHDQLGSATEDRIRRMRQSQIDAAVRDYAQRSKELQKASKQADITTERIMIGTIEITPA
jgi:hypothetical protein